MIIQFRLHNPLSVPLVITEWSFEDLGTGESELCTAGYGDGWGEGVSGEEFFEGAWVGDFCCCCVFGGLGELHLGGTAEGPDAAEIGVALGDDVGNLEIL